MLIVKSAIFFSLALLSLVVNANTIGDLNQSQSNTILYKSKASEYEALNKLNELNGKKAPKPVVVNNDQYQPSGMGSMPRAKEIREEPIVLSVLGVNGLLFANFMLSDGSSIEGKVGMTLPGDYRVVSISATQVILRKDNKNFTASHYK